MSKQNNKDKSDSSSGPSQRDLEADFLLNKHVFRTAAYSVAGFGLGLAASLLFFKHKATMSMFFAGTGAGYGVAGFTNDWSNYRRYRSWAQNQTQRLQRDGDVREGLRDFDGYVLNQYSQGQRNQNRSGQQRESQQRDDHRQERSQHRDDSRQDRGNQQRDDHRQEKGGQQRDDHRQEKGGQDQKQDKSQQNKGNQDQRKQDDKSDKDAQKKSDGQAQQGKHDGQQNKQQGKEQPLNKEAKEKQDIANQKPGSEGKKGQQTQDKKQEAATHSQSIQGSQHGTDEHQRGEKGPQNSQIPPSQKDHTGGLANQGVNPQQVHRGSPDNDKLGKPQSSGDGNKQVQKDAKGQGGNQALEGKVDMKGQHLQTFESNPLPLGKAGLTHEIQTASQQGRNQANDPDLDNTRRRQAGLEQDRRGQSVTEGNNIKVKESSETRAGLHGYKPGVAEQNTKNQVNAVIE